MRSGNLAPERLGAAASEDIFEMTNLSPRMTDLPMTVWVSPRGNAQHDVRVKVNTAPGNQMTMDDTATVAVRPSPHVIAARLSPSDERAVFGWIALNAAAIIAYWDGDIDTAQLAEALRPLPNAR